MRKVICPFTRHDGKSGVCISDCALYLPGLPEHPEWGGCAIKKAYFLLVKIHQLLKPSDSSSDIPL